MMTTAARSSPLWQAILTAPWVGPACCGWGSGRGNRPTRKPQPLVDLIERALDEWPIEAVDAVLDEYFREPETETVYPWQAIQAQSERYKPRSRECLLSRAPRPTGDEFFPEDYR